MQPDDVRVEVGQHRDAADDRLQRARTGRSTSASQNRSRRSRRIRTTNRNVTIATTTRTKVSRRLPNSMTPWMPISGVGTSESARASRPGGAAESGAGQAYEPARSDDPDLDDQRRPRRGDDAAIDARGQPLPEASRRAPAREGGGRGVRGHRASPPGNALRTCAGEGSRHPVRRRNPVESKGRMRARRAQHH